MDHPVCQWKKYTKESCRLTGILKGWETAKRCFLCTGERSGIWQI